MSATLVNIIIRHFISYIKLINNTGVTAAPPPNTHTHTHLSGIHPWGVRHANTQICSNFWSPRQHTQPQFCLVQSWFSFTQSWFCFAQSQFSFNQSRFCLAQSWFSFTQSQFCLAQLWFRFIQSRFCLAQSWFSFTKSWFCFAASPRPSHDSA